MAYNRGLGVLGLRGLRGLRFRRLEASGLRS